MKSILFIADKLERAWCRALKFTIVGKLSDRVPQIDQVNTFRSAVAYAKCANYDVVVIDTRVTGIVDREKIQQLQDTNQNIFFVLVVHQDRKDYWRERIRIESIPFDHFIQRIPDESMMTPIIQELEPPKVEEVLEQ